MIVAGPGAGKTTVLVLRALRHVFVDGLQPENVVLTTFTRKAAEEIRSRLLEWGLQIVQHLLASPLGSGSPISTWLQAIDINRFVTGTVDSICEDILTTQRDPGDPVPVLAETFVANAWLRREALYPGNIWQNTDVSNYLATFAFDGEPPVGMADLTKICRTLFDRFLHDSVDLHGYRNDQRQHAARQTLAAAFDFYTAFMDQTHRLDFARLESRFLSRLRTGSFQRFVSSVKALLVDEYQDTNPLQEQLYFELFSRSKSSLTVVGDDDQSVYRFRGATVELFRDFRSRLAQPPIGSASHRIDLTDNFRSTPEIVSFFNTHIVTDTAFSHARVQPIKPPIAAQLPRNGIPVLGMFRSDAATLAKDLGEFLLDVFRRGGHQLPPPLNGVTVVASPTGGDFGDAVVLGHSVNEFKSSFGAQIPKPRLPSLLRQQLAAHNIPVFNPRGRDLRDIEPVQQLLGVMLECLDPAPAGGLGVRESQLLLRTDSRVYFERWRAAARTLIAANPQPSTPHTLSAFVSSWQQRISQTSGMAWPREWPLLELCFKLLSWFPAFRVDPESQVYLEAIARCIAESATVSPYRSLILRGQAPHDDRSVDSALRDVFSPIAEKLIDVDEDIMPHVPRTCLNFMTIHQAKGLEFPLVIVDVACDYKTNHPKNRFKRYPEGPSSVAAMEDDLAPHCAIGGMRTARSPLARTFDDLVRMYYVAYSRAQAALLLVGLDNCLQYKTTIRHVGLGWRSDGSWAWQTAYSGKKAPGMANNLPPGFQLI